jgi:hypothetical protein
MRLLLVLCVFVGLLVTAGCQKTVKEANSGTPPACPNCR